MNKEKRNNITLKCITS